MPETAPPALLSAALDAAARGWRVFPLRPDDKRPTGHATDRCPGTGRCTDGHLTPEQRATRSPELIRRCWARRPYGVGIATGPSGLLVLDLDVPKESRNDAPCGAATFRALCERADQPWPETFTVATPSGGWHLYFTAPADMRLGNTARQLGPGLDTRGWGGYVVAPGSTVAGTPYRVELDTAVVELPGWLREALTPAPKPHGPAAVPEARDASAYAAAALRYETANVTNSPDGARNWTLLRAARALGRLIASGDLDQVVVEEALSGAAVAAGGESQRYYDDVIRRGLAWSLAHNTAGRRPA